MAWQNWSTLEYNLIELSRNCTSVYYSKPLLGFLLTDVHYIILFYIMGFVGLIQNFLVIQTLVSVSYQEKWSTVYCLVYSINGLFIAISLMISVFYNYGYFIIIGFVCVTLNSVSFWISAVLAFERMLLQLFFTKLYGITSQHAIMISIILLFLVTSSYLLSMIFSHISLLIFFFHLIGPGIIHFISLIITYTSIIERRCYLTNTPITFASVIQICLNQRAFAIAPLCIIICLIISITSIQRCFLICFNISFFFPVVNSFIIYFCSSKNNMKNFKAESVCGRLLMKFHC
jgi:hypothetical protein